MQEQAVQSQVVGSLSPQLPLPQNPQYNNGQQEVRRNPRRSVRRDINYGDNNRSRRNSRMN